MNKKVFLLFLLPALLFADTHVATTTVRFNGTSTLHDFEGSASAIAPATWTPTVTGGVLSIPRIAFETKTLSTDHAKRDANMMKMLDPATHPSILGSVNAWRLTPGTPSEQLLTLELNGVSRDIPVKVLSFSEDAEGLQLVCEFSLSLKAFSLQRPSAVLGIIRVGDTVTLHVETTLRTP